MIGNALQDSLLPHLGNASYPTSHLIHAHDMQHLRSLLQSNMDSLVVLLHRNTDTDSLVYFNELAQSLNDAEVDFVHVEVEGPHVDLQTFFLSSCSVLSLEHIRSSVCTHNVNTSLPAVVFYPGLSQADFVKLYKDDQILVKDVSLPSPVMLGSITFQPNYTWKNAIQSWIESFKPAKGSVYTVTLQNKVQAIKSVHLIKQALKLRPVQPELHYFLSNIGSSIPVWDVLKESLQHAEDVYDIERSRGNYAKTTLASLYYKLASIYQQVKCCQHSIL